MFVQICKEAVPVPDVIQLYFTVCATEQSRTPCCRIIIYRCNANSMLERTLDLYISPSRHHEASGSQTQTLTGIELNH